MKARTALSRSNLPGLDYALNPYRGCGHGCVYCYAPDILRMGGGEEWGSFCHSKEGLPNILARELKSKKKGVIGLGTVTDPYQPQESEKKLTRYCLEQIARKQWPVCIQTKSDLIVRDIDLIRRIDGAEVAITITTIDNEISERIEPGAPMPGKRLAALSELNLAGIRAWAFLGPVIPTINDGENELVALLSEVRKAGAGQIQYDRLRLKPVLSARMREKLGPEFEKIEKLAADPAWFGRVSACIERTCGELGITAKKAF